MTTAAVWPCAKLPRKASTGSVWALACPPTVTALGTVCALSGSSLDADGAWTSAVSESTIWPDAACTLPETMSPSSAAAPVKSTSVTEEPSTVTVRLVGVKTNPALLGAAV